MDRLKTILKEIPTCEVFADIGCDHGYVTKGMLDCNKCKSAIISDISPKCLCKAERLLEGFIKQGRVKSFVSDGFENIPDNCDVALIAGMGGEEIIKILKNRELLPDCLVLQPMKNVDKLRVFLNRIGYRIVKDFTFYDGQFYELITAKKGEDKLSVEEIEFGRTNLTTDNPDFRLKIQKQINDIDERLKNNLSEKDRINFINKKERLKKYV